MSSLEHYRSAYVSASLRAGDIARQFNFAGIALIWIFKSGPTPAVQNAAKAVIAQTGYFVPLGLYWPTQLIIVSLILDLLQYAYKSAFLGIYSRRLEVAEQNRISKSAEGKKIEIGAWLNYPTLVCFWGKLGATVVGFAFLLNYVSQSIVFKG